MPLIMPVVSLLWKALVFKTGVHWLSPASNDRKERATFGTMLNVATLFVVASVGVTFMKVLGWPLAIVGSTAYLCAWFYVFARYFGLGFFRTVVLAVFVWAGQGVLWMLLKVLPFVEPGGFML